MSMLHIPALPVLGNADTLQSLVESRSVYTLQHCEMNIFETHEQSEQVHMQFNSLVFTAMFRGKKVVHLNGLEPFEFVPGESVIVPEYQQVAIDFPEAGKTTPTQCLALAIDKDNIQRTLDMLNEKFAKTEAGDRWQLNQHQLHLKNSRELSGTIDRLVMISKEDNTAKDILANFVLQELLIRLMQTQARELLLKNYTALSTSHRFAFIIKYIREHLHQQVTVQQLSRLACMSKPNFFRSFKRELGISPVEFLIQERIAMAKKLLKDPRISINDIINRSGFNNSSYFFQVFKKHEGLTPATYRKVNRNQW